QIAAVAGDIGVDAAKTGMLASVEIIDAVCGACDDVGIGQGGQSPLVLDPVAASMRGEALLREEALNAIRTGLMPRATLVTPNLDEVRLLTGIEVTDLATQRDAAKALLEFGPRWVLVKGGHLRNSPECLDLLAGSDAEIPLSGPRYDTPHTHGGGDTIASAITASLAYGHSLEDAVAAGKRFIERSVAAAYPLGAG